LKNTVRKYREKKNWSICELAGRARITSQSLYNLENGAVEKPHRSTMAKLARALGVSVKTLFPNKTE